MLTAKCSVCNKEIPHYRIKCYECLEKDNFAKAKKIKIEDYEGTFIYDYTSDEYYKDIDEFLDYCEREDVEPSKYVYGCKPINFILDMYRVVENELENNHYENAIDNIDKKSLESLQEMVDEWTKSQNIVSYEQDYQTIILLD